ncbi:MAG: hypothetical protein IPP48_10850 [Chitinophagaceae bacterium]|nr:hypothetical protein [Chitinophagaceae bacterium]
MRKLILATIILFSSLLVYSQKNNKISYCAFLNIGGVTSNNTGNPVEYVPIDMEVRNINGTVNFLSFRQLFNEKPQKKMYQNYLCHLVAALK